MILVPKQHTFTDLTLHSDIYFSGSSELSLDGLHFPHLYSLSLSKFVLETSVGIEPFILRHAASLAQLELIACMLPTNLGTLPLPWVPLPPLPSSGRCWDSIWDCFVAELSALVALHVHNLECEYVSTCFGLSFSRDGACESREVLILRHFNASVWLLLVDQRRCEGDSEEGEVEPNVFVPVGKWWGFPKCCVSSRAGTVSYPAALCFETKSQCGHHASHSCPTRLAL